MAEFVLKSVQSGSASSTPKTAKQSPRIALNLVRRRSVPAPTPAAGNDSEGQSSEPLKSRSAFAVTKLSPLWELSPGSTREQIDSAVDRSIAASCEEQHRTSLDCLVLHHVDQINAFHGSIWRRVLEHVQGGRIQRLGVSVRNPQEARTALINYHIEHIQLPFNLFDWRWREAGLTTQMLRRRDLTVHACNVFLDGLLACEDPEKWPRIEGVDPAAVLTRVRDQASELGRESVADLCMAYVRGQEFIDGVVVETDTDEQLDLSLRLAVKRPLTAQECRLVDERLPHVTQRLLNPALWPKR